MAIHLGDAVVKFLGQDEGLEKVTKTAIQRAQSLGKAFTVAGAAITAMLVKAVSDFASFGSQIYDLAQRTGMSTEALSKLGYAAGQTGGSLEGLELGVRRLQRAIDEAGQEGGKAGEKFKDQLAKAQETAAKAADKLRLAQAEAGKTLDELRQKGQREIKQAVAGGKSYEQVAALRQKWSEKMAEAEERGTERVRKAYETYQEAMLKAQDMQQAGAEATDTYSEALGRLGLTYDALKGLAPEKQFMTVVTRLADVKDATQRAALAQELLGRSGTQLLPMLEGGAAGLKALGDEAERLGIVLTSEGAAKADALGDAWGRVKASMQGAAITIGTALAPILESLLDKVTNVIVALSNWAKAHPAVTTGILAVAGAAGALMLALGPILIALPGLVTAFSLLGITGPASLGALAAAVGPVVIAIGLLGAAAALWYKNWDEIVAGARMIWETFVDTVKSTWESGMHFIGSAVRAMLNLMTLDIQGFIVEIKNAINYMKELVGMKAEGGAKLGKKSEEMIAEGKVRGAEEQGKYGYTPESFQMGGWIKKSGLALVHAGEFISPAGRAAAAAARKGLSGSSLVINGGINITVPPGGSLDPKKLAAAIFEEIRFGMRGAGAST